ncbi:HAD family hydrolase [Haloglomus litoreum]|uniref:HAD family hydrolase n=1 Tax=Haloglomus litoreum TaxID=3034026 RepID=UPI0023E8D665|nr:HAD-IA family hydrolase [Haloglomus sp. DT116]
MSPYDAVLFDNDGVLVEPPAPTTQAAAIEAAFESVGVPDVDPAHVDALRHGVTVERLRDIAAAYDLDPAALWAARERFDEDSQVDAFRAGDRTTYDDVDAVGRVDGPRGVVSNNHHSTVAFVLDHFDLGGWFDTHYGRPMTVESLDLKKPNTHYLDRALADLDAASALYVGDSASDVVAAERAGLDSAFVRREHCPAVPEGVAPTHVVDGLDEVAAIANDGDAGGAEGGSGDRKRDRTGSGDESDAA